MTAAPPPPPRSADEQARFDAGLIEMFERHITFNQVLGLKVLSVAHGDVRGRIEMRPELVGHFTYGRLHGGVISAVLDAMGGLALMVEIAHHFRHESAAQVMHRFGRMGTIDLRVDYLRQGLGAAFVAKAEVLRLGGRVGTAQMRLEAEGGPLVAAAMGAYMVS